jgi:hypothetical protein
MRRTFKFNHSSKEDIMGQTISEAAMDRAIIRSSGRNPTVSTWGAVFPDGHTNVCAVTSEAQVWSVGRIYDRWVTLYVLWRNKHGELFHVPIGGLCDEDDHIYIESIVVRGNLIVVKHSIEGCDGTRREPFTSRVKMCTRGLREL